MDILTGKYFMDACLFGMPGNLIILKNVKPLLPHGGYGTRSDRGEIYEAWYILVA